MTPTPDWKLVRRADDEAWRLYDLSNDIGETQDLASQRSDLARDLATRFSRWHESVRSDPSRAKSLGRSSDSQPNAQQ